MQETAKLIELPFISRDSVRDEIRRIAGSETESLSLLDHALERMIQRDISMRQIINVLKNGEQIGDIRWCSDKERGWRCKLKRMTAGINVTVVAKLVNRENTTCLVVTVWGQEE